MSAAKALELLLARLSSDTPDALAIVEAVRILAATVARQKKSDRQPLVVATREDRQLRVWPNGLIHDHFASDCWNGVVRLDVTGDPAPPALGEQGTIMITRDDGFTWSWREVAGGLASAIRAIPPRTRAPKSIRCPHCRREFYR